MIVLYPSIVFLSVQCSAAIAYGDPHFTTLDETTYTFNGLGEFWLLKVTEAMVEDLPAQFYLQARMQQVPQMGCKHKQ